MASSVSAKVRVVARSSIPRPPLKAPITLTPQAIQRLHLLQKQHLSAGSINGRLDSAMNPTSNTTAAPTGYIKIGMKAKGCSGSSYTLFFTDRKEPMDEQVMIPPLSHPAPSQTTSSLSAKSTTTLLDKNVEAKSESLGEAESVKLLIDSKALLSIIGSRMDYQEDKLQAGFVFENPNIKDTCGCGLSFVV